MKETLIMEKLSKHAERVTQIENTILVFMAVFGSQNYGLATDSSDLDVKAMCLPMVNDIFLHRELISKQVEVENVGSLEYKDVRLMLKNFLKQNINFLEILFTPYSIIPPPFSHHFERLIDNREKIAHYDNYQMMNAIGGMIMQANKLFQRDLTETSYNGKAARNVVRLWHFCQSFFGGQTFEESLVPSWDKLLVLRCIQSCNLPLKDVQECVYTATQDFKVFEEKYKENNPHIIDHEVEKLLDDIVQCIMIHYMRIVLTRPLK